MTWTKVASIPYVDDFLKPSYIKVLYVLKNGQVLMLCGSTFVLFDAMDCTFRYLQISNRDGFKAISTYFESLVSPLG